MCCSTTLICLSNLAYFARFNFRISSTSHFNPSPYFRSVSSLCILGVPVVVVPVGHSLALLANSPPASPLSPSAQPVSLLPLCLSQPGLCRAAPCGIRALPRRDPSLTSPCWDAATFPAKHCLPWLYYVCLRRSPASRGRQRRRETGSQSQDKEKAGRKRLAKGYTGRNIRLLLIPPVGH